MTTPATHQTADAGATAAEPHLDIPVDGMTCGHCAARVEDGLKAVDGVLGARADVAAKAVAVDYDPARVAPGALVAAIRDAGYTPGPLTASLPVEGLHCMSCVMRLQSALEDLPGVVSADVDLAERLATVVYEPDSAAVGDLVAAVDAAGYRVAAG